MKEVKKFQSDYLIIRSAEIQLQEMYSIVHKFSQAILYIRFITDCSLNLNFFQWINFQLMINSSDKDLKINVQLCF